MNVLFSTMRLGCLDLCPGGRLFSQTLLAGVRAADGTGARGGGGGRKPGPGERKKRRKRGRNRGGGARF